MPAPATPQATDVPSRIETERLVLRPWSSEDLEALHEALTESVEHLKPWIPWATANVGGIGWFPRIGPGGLEIGYWMRLSRAGSGLATEATRAMTRAGLRIPGIERLEIHLDPANVSSRRVPEKLGYRLLRIDDEDAPDGGTRTTAVFELTLKEVEAA